MAQACACDRCGKFYVVKNNDKKYSQRFSVIDKENIPSYRCENSLDLCDECYEDLEQFMNPTRKSQTI